MTGKFDEKKYEPKKSSAAYPPEWAQENDLDWTSPYPCGVCGQSFTSRTILATHSHRKAAR